MESPVATIPPTLTRNTLWDEAYKSLKENKEKAKFVEAYEKILSRAFLKKTTLDITSPSHQNGENTIAQDPPSREKQMKQIVEKGLEKIERAKKTTEVYGKIFDLVTPFKAVLDAGLTNVPQAALPWAVVSSSLDILAKPAKAGKVLYTGVKQVVSRMDWYSRLTDNLLSRDNIKDDEPLEKVCLELEKRILDLYQALLFYQIKSVCYYYRHQFWVFVRGFVDLDDWSGDLKAVTDAEEALRKDSEQYNKERIKGLLERILMNANDRVELQREIEQEKEDKKCLKDLRGIDPRYEIQDITDRKDALVDESYKWFLATDEYKSFVDWENPSAPSLLWISGQAGTGKTMLLIGIIQELTSKHLSNPEAPDLSYFFCQGTSDQLNNGLAVLRALVWLLLLQQPHLISHVRDEYKPSGEKLFNDILAFTALSAIFKRMLDDENLDRVFLIIDALDECDEETRPSLIRLLNTVLSKNKKPSKVKWLVSSRPSPEIEIDMMGSGTPIKSNFKLDEHNLERPINAYIDYKVLQLRDKGYGNDRLSFVAAELRKRASNTFLWVWLVCKELVGARARTWNQILETVPRGLTKLYDYLLDRIEKLKREVDSEDCKRVLAAATLAYRPLTLSEIGILADLPSEEEAGQVVELCGSFLAVRSDTVDLIHQSAQDYLSENYRKLHDVAPNMAHLVTFERCLEGMKGSLNKNIYRLPNWGTKSLEVRIPSPDPLRPVRYACRYWVQHLEQSKTRINDHSEVYSFLQERFLHWLEALSLIGEIAQSITLIGTLLSLIATDGSTKLSPFLNDARHFILQNSRIVDTSPLQLYSSAIIFAPETSIIRHTFKDEIPKWMRRLPKMHFTWSPALQKLEGHTEWVNAVAFSHDGQLLASASGDETIRLWNPATGKELQKFKVKANVRMLSFSTEGSFLETNAGFLKVECRPPASLLRTDPVVEILLKGRWFTRDSENLLWVPDEYIPACSAFQRNVFALGCWSGRVIFLEFR